ncbi:MAG: polysaccharide pyruvyl transferase family protein [Bacteroidales bacterium]|nr:polysaccharide pyruvyl transferase family protein [Bacteroidales bacterium]
MRILVIGQCTLHWGRMEYGNIGNYYIVEPFFRELHRVFSDAEIVTTFQMTDEFCSKEQVIAVPMDLYYGWNENDLEIANKELEIATHYQSTKEIIEETPFISEVMKSDLVIDFSGDIWGDNANLVGKNRFLVGLLKDRVVQLLGKPIAMLAGSPGPFEDKSTIEFAKQVFDNFDLVTNREKISRDTLTHFGFDTSRIVELACPAFLFEPKKKEEIEHFISNTSIMSKEKPVVGFILCGWNMLEGPFDKWPRDASEYTQFVDLIVKMIKELNVKVCLMSHSNGFELPPNFKLIKGRDYPIVEQLYTILQTTDVANEVFLLQDIYLPAETKGIISQFDMLVSGRIHAAVAALSQTVPTTIIDYGHEPKAHKLKGFAEVAGVLEYVADPVSIEDMTQKVMMCWENRVQIKTMLEKRMPEIKDKARSNFDLLKTILR